MGLLKSLKVLRGLSDSSPNDHGGKDKDRCSMDQNKIDDMQRLEASAGYRKRIYKRFYSDYPEKPYISQDREFNTDWIERANMFPEQSIIPKSMMKRYSDGLLPGHVYMLYWLGKYTNKRVPVYFEYKYGVDFTKEREFLKDNGFIDDAGKPTPKGEKAIKDHAKVIQKHTPKKPDPREQTLKQKRSLVQQGFEDFVFLANRNCCEICASLNGRHFSVSDLRIGVNAPPMHEGCCCSVAAYTNPEEHEKWLSHFS